MLRPGRHDADTNATQQHHTTRTIARCREQARRASYVRHNQVGDGVPVAVRTVRGSLPDDTQTRGDVRHGSHALLSTLVAMPTRGVPTQALTRTGNSLEETRSQHLIMPTGTRVGDLASPHGAEYPQNKNCGLWIFKTPILALAPRSKYLATVKFVSSVCACRAAAAG